LEKPLKEFLDTASAAYYKGEPIISDEEFDRLAQAYSYNVVGHTISGGIPHRYKMYSLQKYFDINDAPDLDGYISTPKLDGAAISILYVEGQLAMALTRGDGNKGQDITDKVRLLVPNEIMQPGTVQITGEVVCPSSVTNARNVAAGSLNLKDIEEFKKRPLTFVAYDIQGNHVFSSWAMALNSLQVQQFNTVHKFNADEYPTDGIVYRLDSYKNFEKMGYTAHHPRGAFALKEQKEGVITTLLDVVWQVGKSGVVSPVAILEPIEIGDAVVSRATLHNIEYIRELDLELGCKVEVIRSGEIIPRIVKKVVNL
jgi:DNA ligase (NAD+)